MTRPLIGRRRLLRALATLGAGAAVAGFTPGARKPAAPELCATPGTFDKPLLVPGTGGRMGRLAAGGRPVVLRAAPYGRDGALAFSARADGRDYVDPTLVAGSGSNVAIRLENRLDEPTVAHWHGLTMDTANDGNGEALIGPDGNFDYAFTVRNRASLYWYHPHPHGRTAAQTSRGLFGLIAVEDDDEVKLRAALSLVPGETEIPLVLHDRRANPPYRYTPSAEDLLLGWYGDEVLVNFTPRPYLDVTGRSYRFRVLNAGNARNFRLAFRRDDGAPVPFLLLGTDGGLLEQAQPCTEVFLSPAERIDVLVDFAGIPVGGYVLLESRAFDPMQTSRHRRPSQEARARSNPMTCARRRSPVSLCPTSRMALRSNCCSSASAPRTLRCCHPRRGFPRRRRRFPPPMSDRCALASPRAAGGSTTRSTTWRLPPSSSFAARSKPG